MLNGWLFAAFGLIAINWISVWSKWLTLDRVTKPAVILALLAWLSSNDGCQAPGLWFGAGLAFSLIGDTLLLLPKRFFLYGAGSFLLAHIAYIIGFNQPIPCFTTTMIALLMIFASLLLMIFAVIRRALNSSPTFQRMAALLSVYSLAIGLMVLSALATILRQDWTAAASGLAASGALLFLFSDILLAIDRFVWPLSGARLWKRAAYHLGQLALIAGALVNFSR